MIPQVCTIRTTKLSDDVSYKADVRKVEYAFIALDCQPLTYEDIECSPMLKNTKRKKQ